MKKTLLLPVLVLLFLSCKNNAEHKQPKKENSVSITSKIDSLLKSYGKNESFMGSVSLMHKGKTIYSKSVGISNVQTNKRVNTNTKYRIGSISKTFTAALIFKAVEENLLTLNSSIETYFPVIKNAHKITIAHLLQHRSGIHSFTRDKRFFNYRTEYKSPEEMLSLITKYESDFEPNSKGEYSNSNYFLLAQILESIYKKTYNDILLDKICKPLGLNNTYVGTKIKIANNECHSYRYDNKWRVFKETDLSIAKGSGSIISTPKDVNIFMEALFTNKILSKKSIALMCTIKDNFGMGMHRYKINDRQGFGHRGHIDEFKGTSIYFPKEELALTIISNGAKKDINEVYIDILKVYLNDVPVMISEAEVKKFSGTYVYTKDKTDRVVFTQDKDKLVLLIKNEFKNPLNYKGNNRFVFNQVYAESMSFTFTADGKQMLLEQGSFKGVYIKE